MFRTNEASYVNTSGTTQAVFREQTFKVQLKKTKKGKSGQEEPEKVVKTYQGKDYTVVPVVMMVQGVRHAANAKDAELVLINEIAKYPAGWNGRPIVANHPQDSAGHYISAGDPEVMEKWSYGIVFNTTVDGDKLKGEMWLDESRANELGGAAKDCLDRILAGDIIEVSTGYFCGVENMSGRFNGAEYSGKQNSIVPDHLATLDSNKTGACSVEDGCGGNRANASCSCEDKAACSCSTTTDVKMPKGNVFQKVLDAVFRVDMTDQDKRSALQIALGMVCDSRYVYVVAVEDTKVTYCDYDSDYNMATYQRNYSISADGTINIGNKATVVTSDTRFVEVKVVTTNTNSATQEENMTQQTPSVNDAKKAKVDAVIAASSGAFTEEHRANLSAMPDAGLDSMLKAYDDAKKAPTTVATPAAVVEQPAANATKELTEEEYLKQAPAGIRAALESAVRLQNSRRDELVKAIKANARNKFSDDQLKAFDMGMLEQLAEIANTGATSFAINGGFATGTQPAANEGDKAFTPAPKVFVRKDETAAA